MHLRHSAVQLSVQQVHPAGITYTTPFFGSWRRDALTALVHQQQATSSSETNPMLYLPAGRPDMTLSLPIISAGVGAAALTGLLLLLAGAGDPTEQTGLISG